MAEILNPYPLHFQPQKLFSMSSLLGFFETVPFVFQPFEGFFLEDIV
jgi:hypothetical protein